MKRNYLLYATALILVCGCNRENNIVKNNFGLYDISIDDKFILFSYISNNTSSVYEINIDSGYTKKIITSTNDSSYYNPKYSKKSNKILFIGSGNDGTHNSAIYIANRNGTDREKLTDGKSLITDGFFSECEDKIYYCQANEYGHYSPLGTDQPHGVDIYSISLDNKELKR